MIKLERSRFDQIDSSSRIEILIRLTRLSSKNANSKRAIIKRTNRIPLLEENSSLLFIVSKLFLPLITVDDWAGQDSLAEEFPLSGRNTEYRLKFNVFGAPIVLSDPLQSYPLSPQKDRPWFFFFLSFHYSAWAVSRVIKSVGKHQWGK